MDKKIAKSKQTNEQLRKERKRKIYLGIIFLVNSTRNGVNMRNQKERKKEKIHF